MNECKHDEWRSRVLAKNPARPLKVRLLREAGGLGDVICCLPALKWLRENFAAGGLTARAVELLNSAGATGLGGGDECELVLYGFGPYHAVWDLAGVPHTWRSQMHNNRCRRLRWQDPCQHYGESRDEFALSVDLWCPFWLHETARAPGFPKLSRLELACLSAGMRPEEITTPKLLPSAQSLAWARQWLAASGWSGEPVVLLFPMAAGPARCWPHERWAAVARALWRDRGVRVIVLAGRIFEIGWWYAHAPEFARLPGLDWERLAALTQLADLVLTGDTGSYHLAAAVNTPALGLFGMTSGEITSRHYPRARWLQGAPGRELTEVSPGAAHCRTPCYHRWQSGFGGDLCKQQGCAALLSLGVDEVTAAARESLEFKVQEFSSKFGNSVQSSKFKVRNPELGTDGEPGTDRELGTRNQELGTESGTEAELGTQNRSSHVA